MCLLVPCYRGHPDHRRCRGAAETEKAVHPDAALAHHQDGPAARCSDDIVAALHQPGACLAAHQNEIVLAQNQALPAVLDSVALLKVRRKDVKHLARLPQDVLPQAHFPVLRQAAAARQDAAQGLLAQRRDVRR